MSFAEPCCRSPHLNASAGLCAALEHEAAYPTETLARLMQEANVGESDAAALFEDVTGKPLRPG